MKVKICGIKTYEEALTAVEAGADMLGFNFYAPSPRYITPSQCLRLQVRLQAALHDFRQNVRMVGVFVNPSQAEVISILGDCNLDMVQLSGDEPPELVAAVGERAYKALRPASAQELAQDVEIYPRRAGPPAWLIDAYRPGEYGGTGQTADWSLAANLAAGTAILLAGGLRLETVAQAIRQVRPWGVDVASGVESQPGCKDPAKVTAFLQAVRRVEQEMLT
jgi:phosphoribosylanthranilate isomerase